MPEPRSHTRDPVWPVRCASRDAGTGRRHGQLTVARGDRPGGNQARRVLAPHVHVHRHPRVEGNVASVRVPGPALAREGSERTRVPGPSFCDDVTQERLAVLVTDGQERAALAVVRSLGRAGHRVFVCSPAARSLAGASRHALQQARVPDALAAPDAFVAAVQRLLSDWQINVIVPISEAALLALLPERARLTGVCMPFASSEQFRRICDKETVLQAATEIGIATPSQRTVAYPDDRVGFSPDGLQFPVVVKPARSVADGAGARIH